MMSWMIRCLSSLQRQPVQLLEKLIAKELGLWRNALTGIFKRNEQALAKLFNILGQSTHICFSRK
jgi:hypothetical protein